VTAPPGLLRAAAERLRAAGIENPRLEARLLWEHSSQISLSPTGGEGRGEGVSPLAHNPSSPPHPNPLPPRGRGNTDEIFKSLLSRRLAREPLAYITGTKEFWSLEFAVGPGVLIPRPETELTIEAALETFPDKQAPLAALDLGTGSGAILIAFLREFPKARGLGIDASGEALIWARANAARLGVESRCRFQRGNWAEGLAGPFDAIFANPPYIDAGDMARLAPEVGRFEPHLALSGGADGLDAYRALALQIPPLLAFSGRAFVEMGLGLAPSVADLFRAQGLEIGPIRPDLSGIPRCLELRLPPQKNVGMRGARS